MLGHFCVMQLTGPLYLDTTISMLGTMTSLDKSSNIFFTLILLTHWDIQGSPLAISCQGVKVTHWEAQKLFSWIPAFFLFPLHDQTNTNLIVNYFLCLLITSVPIPIFIFLILVCRNSVKVCRISLSNWSNKRINKSYL